MRSAVARSPRLWAASPCCRVARPAIDMALPKIRAGRSRCRLAGEGRLQGAEMLFVAPPACDGGAEDRLAHLGDARGLDRAFGPVEGEDARIPRQAEMFEDAPCLALQVLDHVLIADFEHGAGRKDLAPVV